MSYTKGPWRWEDIKQWGKSSTYYCRNLVGPDGSPVLSGEDYSIEMQIENARIIAAAPDLLEALKTLDARGGLGLDVHEWIRGLINKAEGVAK